MINGKYCKWSLRVFQNQEDDFVFQGILPTATQYARTYHFAGLMPLKSRRDFQIYG